MSTDPRCGTTAGRQAHNRRGETTCGPCRAAAAADWRRRAAHDYLTRGQKQTVDATGTRRRIRALVRIGWPLAELADRLGVSLQNVYAYTQRDHVWRSTVAKVNALYDELSMIPGPSTIAMKRARSKGWFPPLAWDDDTIDDPAARATGGTNLHKTEGFAFDEIAVARAMHGDPLPLRPVERAEAVRRLTAQGLSATQIGDRLGIDARSVQRLRGPRPEAVA